MVTLFHPLLDHFLGKGIAVVSIDYRLFEDGVYFPDNIFDVSDALCYLKQHESLLTLDTSQLLVWGDSAGAALMLATALDRHRQFAGDLGDDLPTIKGVIALYPPTNFLLFKFIQTWLAHLKFYEGSREEWRELMVKCSPVSHLYGDAPPILLLHGKKDPIVPFGQALHFVEHASDVGANVQLISFPNGTHSLASFLQSDNPIKEEQLMARINRFIEECLG
jgi:triacylglycerol lipase